MLKKLFGSTKIDVKWNGIIIHIISQSFFSILDTRTLFTIRKQHQQQYFILLVKHYVVVVVNIVYLTFTVFTTYKCFSLNFIICLNYKPILMLKTSYLGFLMKRRFFNVFYFILTSMLLEIIMMVDFFFLSMCCV